MRKKNSQPVVRSRKSAVGKIFSVVLALVAAAVGFFIAEKAGVTGTSLLFSPQENAVAAEENSGAEKSTRTREKSARKSAGEKVSDGEKKSVSEKNPSGAGGGKNVQKSLSPQKKKSAGTPQNTTIPDFGTISQREDTWPTFVRLTRARNIALTDAQTGTAMGRMDVPAGTVVKVRSVLPNGTLVVFDRTGQIFQVSAQGTNFSEAYIAKKNKPKKKATKPKKTVVAQKVPEPKTAASAKEQPARGANSDASSGSGGNSAKRISAFGVFEDSSSWGEDEDE